MAETDTNALLAEIRDLMKDSIQRQKDQRQWYEERYAKSDEQQRSVIGAYKKVILTNVLLVAAVLLGILIAVFANAHH
jgi:hypothetical protein